MDVEAGYHYSSYPSLLSRGLHPGALPGKWRYPSFRPRQFNPEAAFEWRRWRCELGVLDKSLDKPPHKLGAYCFEGPCVSRTRMTIAWTQNYGQEPKPTGRFVIWKADIDYSSGKPQLANQELVIDNAHEGLEGAVLETQNFRPPDEKEIIFQSTRGVETFGYNMETGELVNYSLTSDYHEEPEGIFPDGKATLVESDRRSHNWEMGHQCRFLQASPGWEW